MVRAERLAKYTPALVLGALAQAEHHPLELGTGLARVACDEQLEQSGSTARAPSPHAAMLERDVSPAEYCQPLGGGEPFDGA